MKKIYIPVLLFLMLAIATKAGAQNLVQNWSAELFDAANNNAPLNWTMKGGTWQSQLAEPGFADTAEDGQYFFYAFDGSPDTLEQDVDVSSFATNIDANNQYFSFYGYVQCYPQGTTSDQSRIIVQCLNAAKTSMLLSFDSDTISSPGVWEKVLTNFLAPSGTRYVRIILIATRRSGLDNDGYFDAISLTAGNKTGINNIADNDKVKLYPNPATDQLTIRNAAGKTITLDDVTGREVYKTVIRSSKETLDISALSKGLYVARIQDAGTGEVVVVKVVKN